MVFSFPIKSFSSLLGDGLGLSLFKKDWYSNLPIFLDNMKKVQDEYIDNDDIMLLSMSVTPEIDDIEVLKDYAIEKGVNDSKWNITTGSKKHIYELARKSYFAVVDQGDGGLQDFIHTPNFILVDTKKQIRGIYDGTEDNEILRLIKDINILTN